MEMTRIKALYVNASGLLDTAGNQAHPLCPLHTLLAHHPQSVYDPSVIYSTYEQPSHSCYSQSMLENHKGLPRAQTCLPSNLQGGEIQENLYKVSLVALVKLRASKQQETKGGTFVSTRS